MKTQIAPSQSLREETIDVNNGYWYGNDDFSRAVRLTSPDDEQCAVHWISPKSDQKASTGNRQKDQISIETLSEGINNIRRQKKPQEFKVGDKFLIPLNVRGNHWVGVMAEVKEGKEIELTYYDSLSDAQAPSSDLQNLIKDQFGQAGFQSPTFAARKINIARQPDGSSCGPYTIFHLQLAAYGININPADMPTREQIRAEQLLNSNIVQGQANVSVKLKVGDNGIAHLPYAIELNKRRQAIILPAKKRREYSSAMEIVSDETFINALTFSELPEYATQYGKQEKEEKLSTLEEIHACFKKPELTQNDSNPPAYKGLGAICEFIPGQGFKTIEVVPGSVADKMGLKPGNLVTHLNGEDIRNRTKENEMEVINKFRNAGLENNGTFNINIAGETKPRKGDRNKGNNYICDSKSYSEEILEKLNFAKRKLEIIYNSQITRDTMLPQWAQHLASQVRENLTSFLSSPQPRTNTSSAHLGHYPLTRASSHVK